MAAHKGNNYNPKGRGHSKSKKNLEWEEFGRQLLESGLPRMLETIKTCDEEIFTRTFVNLLEYFKPKLARNEHSGLNGEPIKLTWEAIEARKKELNKILNRHD